MPTLLVCESCQRPDGAPSPRQDADALEAVLQRHGLSEAISVRLSDCMGGCENPVSIGLQGYGMASYVFSGVDPAADSEDIAATCRLFLDSESGWIDDARPCGRLRTCLRARLPALP
ncbi:MAG: DUF1636 domain-containing protein [Alphaproteobacteria bacterium]